MNSTKIKVYDSLATSYTSTDFAIPTVVDQWKSRQNKKFCGISSVGIFNLSNLDGHVIWNRPLTQETLNKAMYTKSTVSDNKVYNFNMPLLTGQPEWKSNYNIIITKGTMPIVAHIKFNCEITEEIRTKMAQIIFKPLMLTLKYYKVPEDSISCVHNDILLNEKKLAGGEIHNYGQCFDTNGFINISLAEFKNIFDTNLTGGYIHKNRPATGVLDEFPNLCTVDQFYTTYKEYFLQELLSIKGVTLIMNNGTEITNE